MRRNVRTFLRTLLNGRDNDWVRTLAPTAAYDRWASAYRSRMNPLQKLEEDALLRLLPDLRGKNVVDVGCGPGRVSRIALERGAASTTGVDASRAMLHEARSLSDERSSWILGDACDLPLEASTFDVVVCALMLGHVAKLDVAVSEMHRVLKPGGYALISGFHPFATLQGAVRTFEDPATGRTYAITQHVHLFEDYLRCFRDCGWVLQALEEPRYEEYPVVFVLRARKQERGEAGP